MKINLQEDGTQTYTALFQHYLDEVQSLCRTVSDELNTVMKESKYDKLQRTVSTLIDQFTERVIHSSETGVFLRWQESGASLRACLELYQAGDGACQVCVETQVRLQEQIHDTLKIEKAGTVITDRPEVTEDGFVQLKELFQAGQSKIQMITRTSLSNINSAADENDIFRTLTPLIQGISAGIEGFFSDAQLEIQKLHEFVKDYLRQLQAQIEASTMPSANTSADTGPATGGGPAMGGGADTTSATNSSVETGPAADSGADTSSTAGSNAETDPATGGGADASSAADNSAETDSATGGGADTSSAADNSAETDPATGGGADASSTAGNSAETDSATGGGADASSAAVSSVGTDPATGSGLTTGQTHPTAVPAGTSGAAKRTQKEPAQTPTAPSPKKLADVRSFNTFQNLTKKLYSKICNDGFKNNQAQFHSAIQQIIAPIYREFYQNYGDLLTEPSKDSDTRRREYIQVTRERNNEPFFASEADLYTFKSHAAHTYTVFDKAADMLQNIAKGCAQGTANSTNLMYGAYVLFTPIIDGCITEENISDEAKRAKALEDFCANACNKLQSCIAAAPSGRAKPVHPSERTAGKTAEQTGSTGKQKVTTSGKTADGAQTETPPLQEDECTLFVRCTELIVQQIGVDELNRNVDRCSNDLEAGRASCPPKSKTSGSQKAAVKAGTDYGRYTVTPMSIQAASDTYAQAAPLMDHFDDFYKTRFAKLDKSFADTTNIIHQMSTLIGLFGLGSFNIMPGFSSQNSDKQLLDKIIMSTVPLSQLTPTGRLIAAGAGAIKLLDWAMPMLKQSKILTRLNEKFWKITRMGCQLEPIQREMDMYMMEHYEIFCEKKVAQSGMFHYIHSIVNQIDEDSQRRIFENAVFAAEMWCLQQPHPINASNQQQWCEIFYGAFLNMIRSGLCRDDIPAKRSNELVDLLYNMQSSNEGITPRVNIDPLKYYE